MASDAILLSGLGLLVTITLWLTDRLWLNRKRFSYRVDLDNAVDFTPTGLDKIKNVTPTVRRGEIEVEKPSMALLRIKNSGQVAIKDDDFRSRVKFEFGGREVVGYAVTEPSDGLPVPTLEGKDDGTPEEQQGHPASGIDVETGKKKLIIPRFWFNKRQRFKLLVLLSGDLPDNEGERVTHEGTIADGKIVREPSRRRLPSRRSLVYGGISLALVGLLTGGLIVNFGNTSPNNVHCVSGDIVVEGSTAFAPIAQQIAKSYEDSCSGVDITTKGTGSLTGINELNNAGKKNPEASRIAMSDVRVYGNYPSLSPQPVAALLFTVVVNRAVGVDNLTLDQIQGIFQGKYSSWSELNGHDIPISIIGRNSGSGTRRAFEQNVLKGDQPPFSSDDCRSKKSNTADTRVPLCEMPDTDHLLEAVNEIDGAIGYAEMAIVRRSSVNLTKVNWVRLNDYNPDIESIRQQKYPFWAIEYFYTYGRPKDNSLVAAFTDYMASEAAKSVLRHEGYFIPCIDSQQNLTATVCP